MARNPPRPKPGRCDECARQTPNRALLCADCGAVLCPACDDSRSATGLCRRCTERDSFPGDVGAFWECHWTPYVDPPPLNMIPEELAPRRASILGPKESP